MRRPTTSGVRGGAQDNAPGRTETWPVAPFQGARGRRRTPTISSVMQSIVRTVGRFSGGLIQTSAAGISGLGRTARGCQHGRPPTRSSAPRGLPCPGQCARRPVPADQFPSVGAPRRARGRHCWRKDQEPAAMGLGPMPLSGPGGRLLAVGGGEWRSGAERVAGAGGELTPLIESSEGSIPTWRPAPSRSIHNGRTRVRQPSPDAAR